MLEIARTLMRDPDILFLDEPTSALPEREVEWLFGLVRELRDRGKCVIFTSHRWREVESIADRITIFRNGENVVTRDRIDESEAVTLMTGQTIDRVYPEPPPAPAEETVFEVRGLSGAGLDDFSFSVRQGEILGIGGLAGQGQRELFLTLFGARKASPARSSSTDGRAASASRSTRSGPGSESPSSPRTGRARACCCR